MASLASAMRSRQFFVCRNEYVVPARLDCISEDFQVFAQTMRTLVAARLQPPRPSWRLVSATYGIVSEWSPPITNGSSRRTSAQIIVPPAREPAVSYLRFGVLS